AVGLRERIGAFRLLLGLRGLRARRLLAARSLLLRRGLLAACGRPQRRRAVAGGRGCRRLRGLLLAAACGPFRRGREQRLALLERQRRRIGALRNLRVLRLVRDVRAVAPVQHLDAGFREVADDSIRIRDLLLLDQLERTLERDRVRVLAADRGERVAVAHVRAEAADVRGHGFAVRRLPELARQLEQVERRLEGDLVHFLPGTKARELRLLLVVLRADLHERAVAPHAHTDRTAAGGVRAEHARLRGLLASDRS